MVANTPTPWAVVADTPSADASVAWGTGDSEGSVEIALPASDVYEVDLFHLRRMMVGGFLSRQYFTFSSGGTTYAVHYRQGNASNSHSSGADPTVHVPALSGATAVEVDLGSSNNTSAQVATATISALSGVGITATTNGTDSNGRTQLVIQNASSLGIPASVDNTNVLLRGMWGLQRDQWGSDPAIHTNADGGTNGTGSQHVGNPSSQTGMTGRDGRIIGAYLFAHNAYRPRLAAASGPSYSTSPGAMTILGQGAIQPGGISSPDVNYVIFDEPIAFDSADELWFLYREDVGGGPRYRLHARTPEGNGDVTASQLLIWDTTAAADYTDVFGSSYTPTVDATYGIYIVGGLIFELQDGSGNYAADGSGFMRIGYHGLDDEAGTQYNATPAQLDEETTHHRFILPNRTALLVSSITRAFNSTASGESCRVCAYGPWANLTIPTGSPPDLIADFGILGDPLTANDFNTLAVSPAVDVSAAANDYWSLGFNYATSDGSALATLELPVWLDSGTGYGYYGNCWTDDRATWHDDIPGASGRSVGNTADRAPTSGVSEYRTTATTMPYADYDTAWPDPFETDASDDSPNAIAIDRADFTWVGFAEVA